MCGCCFPLQLLSRTFLCKLHSRCLQESMWVDKFTFIFISRLLGIVGPKNILWNTCITGSNYFAMLMAAYFWVWHSIQHTHVDKSGLVCKLVCGSEIIKNLRYGISICLKGMRKTTQSLSQDGWCLGQDLKQAPHKYKSETLLLEPTCCVTDLLVSGFCSQNTIHWRFHTCISLAKLCIKWIHFWYW